MKAQILDFGYLKSKDGKHQQKTRSWYILFPPWKWYLVYKMVKVQTQIMKARQTKNFIQKWLCQ